MANALGAHVFAGGFTLGIREHFDILGHVETGTYGVKTAKANFPGMSVWVDDWPGSGELETVDLLYGNPPCAPWSTLNPTSSCWKRDPRLKLSKRHVSALHEYQPKVWLWESTENTWRRGQEFIEEVVRECLAAGYMVNILLENALWHGIPQKRRRMMFCAAKVRFDWEPLSFTPPVGPEELLTLPPQGDFLKETQIKAWEAHRYDKRFRDTWEDLVPAEARRYESRGNRTYCLERPRFKTEVLQPGKPTGVVMGRVLIHYKEPRWLSVDEVKQLCGYPLSFDVGGNSTSNYDLLTRAVMPPVAEYVARSCKANLQRGEPTGPEAWVTDYRDPPGMIFPYFNLVQHD